MDLCYAVAVSISDNDISYKTLQVLNPHFKMINFKIWQAPANRAVKF